MSAIIDKLTISKYTSYFHDGSLIDIQYGESTSEIAVSMESAELDPEDLNDPISLSKENRIKGKLHLNGITKIEVDDEILSAPLKMHHDDAEIFHFRIIDTGLILEIGWQNFSPKTQDFDYSVIKIDVKTVYWENIPDLPFP